MKQYWKRLLWAAVLALFGVGLLPEQHVSFADEVKPWHSQWRIGSLKHITALLMRWQAGVAWDRVIFEWRYFQPNNGKELITTSVPDAWLDQAIRGKRQILGLIKNAPHWATGSDLLGAPALNLDLPITDPQNYWANFVRKLVSYYSKNVGHQTLDHLQRTGYSPGEHTAVRVCRNSGRLLQNAQGSLQSR